MSAIGKFDVRSPFIEHKKEGKEAYIFEAEARKTVGEKIKGLFAVVCAQTKAMTPDSDNKQDLGGLWMQAAGVIAQMMNTDNVERNTTVQKASYNLSLAGFVGRTHEVESNHIQFDGQNPLSVRTDIAPAGSDGRIFQVISESGAILRSMIMEPHDTEVIWDGKDDHDQILDAGHYHIRIMNRTKEGQDVCMHTYVDREIDGVGYDDKGVPHLLEGAERVYDIHKWTKRPEIIQKLYPSINKQI